MSKSKYVKNEVIKSEASSIASTVGDLLIGYPVVGTAVSVGKIYNSIREQAFTEKLESFLIEAQPNPENVRKFKLALKENENNFFKKLWTLIDRLDDEEKATITGRLFKNVLNEAYTVDEFLEAADIISKMYIGYLKSLRKEYLLGDNKAASNKQHRFQLIQNGLLIESDQPAKSESHLRKAVLSPLGKMIQTVI